jgi:uncharacterized membrane protein YbaN (DUF454 family)
MKEFVRLLLLMTGTLCVGLGLAGIVLPLLPATPFLLLAAACYARSSDRFYCWLLNHPWLGEPVRSFRQHRGLRLRHKALALLALWLTVGTTSLTLASAWVKWLLLGVALGVTGYLFKLKTLPARTALTTEAPLSSNTSCRSV